MPTCTTTHPKKATTHSHYSATRPWSMPPPVKALGKKRIKICYKDDGDSGKVGRRRRSAGGAGDECQRQCAAVAIARLMAAAREAKVLRQLLERRLRHRGGRDSGVGAIVPFFKKGGPGRSGTCLDLPEGVDAACRSKMAPWAIERAERARRQRGGEENGGEVALIPLLVGL